jgi:hypothetical protein
MAAVNCGAVNSSNLLAAGLASPAVRLAVEAAFDMPDFIAIIDAAPAAKPDAKKCLLSILLSTPVILS